MHGNFNGAKIVRVKSPDGSRIGAYVQRVGYPDFPVNTEGLKKLSRYLSTSNQRLDGAFITSDGRIYADSKATVSEAVKSADTFALECATVLTRHKDKTNAQKLSETSEKSTMTLRGRVDKDASTLLRQFNVEPDVTEHRLMSTLCAGFELLFACGVEINVVDIKQNTSRRGRYAKYLRVSAHCTSVCDKYMPDISFDVYLDGTLDVTLWEAVSYGEHLIRCKNSSDVRNAILWLCNDTGSCSDKIRTEYTKYHRDAELLMLESERPAPMRPKFTRIMLPHKAFSKTVREHITDFAQLQRQLDKLFGHEYSFSWHVENPTTAILSVAKRTLSTVSDCLFDLRLKLVTVDAEKNCVDTNSTPYTKASLKSLPTLRAVNVSHRLSGERWISLREYACIRYLDDTADAVESILRAVFGLGGLRSTRHILAYEITNGECRYYIRGEALTVSEQEILEQAQSGTIFNGINLRVLKNGEFALESPGYDRYGNEIPKVQSVRGRKFLQVSLGFQDRWKDEWVALTAVVPLEIYTRLHRTERTPSAGLTHPEMYVREMLFESKYQNWIFKVIGKQLSDEATMRGYIGANRAKFLLSFMRQCFHFTPLAYTLNGNRTPVETLIDRIGCCGELSVLAIPFAQALGFDAAIIFRYSPQLETDYHAVLGIKYSVAGLDAINAWKVAQNYVADGDRYHVVWVGGYTGIELSQDTGGLPGVVACWSCINDAAAHSRDTDTPSQVIVVPVSDALIPKRPHAQSGTVLSAGNASADTTPLTDAHWHTVKDWFERSPANGLAGCIT